MSTDPVFFTGTAKFFLQPDGTLFKSPNDYVQHPLFVRGIEREFKVEPAIYEWLGQHPRIISYYGRYNNGFLLRKASHGNLMDFLRTEKPPSPLRLQFCRQSIEALAFIHSKGVLHQDLRPDQFLIDETTTGQYNLYLCDFGGSQCGALDLDGKHMPDSGFFDPELGDYPQQQDLFGIGSICYTILTGHWPHELESETAGGEEYDDRVDSLFGLKIFPDTTNLKGGSTIRGCWEHRFTTADEILAAFDRECSTSFGILYFPTALQRFLPTIASFMSSANWICRYLTSFSVIRFFHFGHTYQSSNSTTKPESGGAGMV